MYKNTKSCNQTCNYAVLNPNKIIKIQDKIQESGIVTVRANSQLIQNDKTRIPTSQCINPSDQIYSLISHARFR